MLMKVALDLRSQQPAGLLGQTQTGQQADDQIHDEEQEVGEPPVDWREV